ncbi:MAG: shikimate kinase [Thermodesulfobacteriota bacterium]
MSKNNFMNLVLIGYRAAGKTTVGKILSRLTGFPFVDTDELIEKQEGHSIKEIVSQKGWKGFREIEKKVIAQVSSQHTLIIAVGGGAILDEENVRNLKKNGFLIWLKAPLPVLSERLARDEKSFTQRPSLTGKGTFDEFAEIFKDREPIYARVAGLEIDTSSGDAEAVAHQILKFL